MSKVTRLQAYAEGAALARSQAARQRDWAARLRGWLHEAEQAAVRADERAVRYEEYVELERSALPPMTAGEMIETIENLTMKRESVA
jgi:hypothetical protein